MSKKWQNGTQAQLDAAKDDARLIPKKTFFVSKLPEMLGVRCYRVINENNDRGSVLMLEWPNIEINDDVYSKCWFNSADELEPCHD